MKKNRIFALLLTIAMTAALTLPAAAWNSENLVPQQKTYTTAFTDTAGTWCDDYVRTCYEAGLLNGKTATFYGAKDPLTYAQIIVITARLHELMNGGDGVLEAPREGQPWYAPAAAYLAQVVDTSTEAGFYLFYDLYQLDDFATESCDRYDFVWYLAAILPEAVLTPINAITSLPDVADEDILRFYNAGILTGSDSYGTFNGDDLLNRGQAAAMLARIIDPAQRVSFTPEIFVPSRAYLGLEPDTPLFTVDGRTVTAEVYCFYLTTSIASLVAENALGLYETYPDAFEDYLADPDFEGEFPDYLQEELGISVNSSIDWNAKDRGGISPARRVEMEALENTTQLAAVLNHAPEYPLTSQQKAEVEAEFALLAGTMTGYSETFLRDTLSALCVMENLMASFAVSPAELEQQLAEEGFIYGQYVTIARGADSAYASDAEARAAADTVRSQMAAHKDDSDYLEYLIWKYSDDYATEPDLIAIEQLSEENREKLVNLGAGEISPVLTEEDRYLVVFKQDPAQDETISQSLALMPAQITMSYWGHQAEVVYTDAFHAIDVALVAQRCGA